MVATEPRRTISAGWLQVGPALTTALIGIFAFALAHSGIRSVAVASSVAAVLILPAAVVARTATDGNLLEQFAFGYAGLALSCWSLWIAAVIHGLDQRTSLLSPVLASVAFAAVCRPAPSIVDTHVPAAARDRRHARLVLGTGVVLACLALVPFCPYGWTAADGVHRMGMTDWYKHLMVTTSLQSDPQFPPANPFLATGLASPYYYGFHLVAAAVHRGAEGGDPFVILLGLTLATAFIMPVVIFVLARGLLGDPSAAVLSAIGGSLLAGFDLLVWIVSAIRETIAHWPIGHGFAAIRTVVPSTHLNFWLHHNERQLNSPYIATIWAPHHVCAALAAALVIHIALPRAGRRMSVSEGILAAVLVAALPALSAYVALAFFVAVGGVIVVEALRGRCAPWTTDAFRRWIMIGAPGAVLSIPVLLTLGGSEGGALILAISSAGSWMNGAVWSSVFGDGTTTRLLDTPALYAVQFGLVGICGVLGAARLWRLRRLTAAQREALTIALGIVLLVTLVRPPVGTPNNLFARPMLLVWLLLACFGGAGWRARQPSVLYRGLLGVCAAGTIFAVVGSTAEGAFFWATPPEIVHAARWINDHAASDALVAAPSRAGVGYWLWRRTVTSDRRLALLFGASGDRYDQTVRQLEQAGEATKPEDAWRRFGEIGVDVIVTDTARPAWGRPPCFETGYQGDSVSVYLRTRTCHADAQ